MPDRPPSWDQAESGTIEGLPVPFSLIAHLMSVRDIYCNMIDPGFSKGGDTLLAFSCPENLYIEKKLVMTMMKNRITG